MLLPEALFRAQNAQKSMSAGASPQTHWWSNSAPPDPLTGFKGPTSKGKGEGLGRGRGGEGGGRGWWQNPGYAPVSEDVKTYYSWPFNARCYA